MKDLLFLICVILISCMQEIDNEVISKKNVKAIPYQADTTILIENDILDISIAYRKGNSKFNTKVSWSAKKDTAFIENLYLHGVFNIQLADKNKQFTLEQAYKSSLFVYVKDSEMPVELEDWKNYYSDYKLNLMDTKMRNVEVYESFQNSHFVDYSAAELREGIKKNKNQFPDNIDINTINELNAEIYPIITETYFKITTGDKILHLVFRQNNGC